jgi:hypothetical protein
MPRPCASCNASALHPSAHCAGAAGERERAFLESISNHLSAVLDHRTRWGTGAGLASLRPDA